MGCCPLLHYLLFIFPFLGNQSAYATNSVSCFQSAVSYLNLLYEKLFGNLVFAVSALTYYGTIYAECNGTRIGFLRR